MLENLMLHFNYLPKYKFLIDILFYGSTLPTHKILLPKARAKVGRSILITKKYSSGTICYMFYFEIYGRTQKLVSQLYYNITI